MAYRTKISKVRSIARKRDTNKYFAKDEKEIANQTFKMTPVRERVKLVLKETNLHHQLTESQLNLTHDLDLFLLHCSTRSLQGWLF